MSGEAILEVSGLRGGYGDELVLQDIELAVGTGEIVAVIGRNGVGKSTLMRTLIGLLRPASGRIRFRSEDVTDQSADRRARLGMGYIPQGRDVFPHLSVKENLLVGEVAARRRASPDYARVFEFFPMLEERSTQRAGTLSGGQQQQLAIGRAMMGDPSLILLDEPSEGIQPSIIQDIARNVRRMNDESGVSVLLVEQNLDLIVSLARRGLVMDKGRIVAELGPEEIGSRDAVRKHLSL